MTAVTCELVAAAGSLPVGIEILLNDPEASLAVALAAGADFIRTDYFADEMSRPEHGAMRIAPEQVIAYRAGIGAERVLVLADIQVKYAQMLTPRTLAESARACARAPAPMRSSSPARARASRPRRTRCGPRARARATAPC